MHLEQCISRHLPTNSVWKFLVKHPKISPNYFNQILIECNLEEYVKLASKCEKKQKRPSG